MARATLLLTFLLVGPFVLAQPSQTVDPETVAPQVIVNVRKHPVGADMVEVTVSAADYPFELLREQARKMAGHLGSDARGLTVWATATDPKFRFVKATFATDGIIGKDGEFRLAPIVKAFLGAPEKYETRSLLVTLEGQTPVEKKTLQEFSSKSVVLKAHASEAPKGVEYRIVALTQDPEKIEVPERYEEPAAPKKADAPAGGDALPVPVLVSLIALAAAAGSALVYFAVSGRSAKHRQRPTGRT